MYTVSVEVPKDYDVLMARAIATVISEMLTTEELEHLIRKLEESEEE